MPGHVTERQSRRTKLSAQNLSRGLLGGGGGAAFKVPPEAVFVSSVLIFFATGGKYSPGGSSPSRGIGSAWSAVESVRAVNRFGAKTGPAVEASEAVEAHSGAPAGIRGWVRVSGDSEDERSDNAVMNLAWVAIVVH